MAGTLDSLAVNYFYFKGTLTQYPNCHLNVIPIHFPTEFHLSPSGFPGAADAVLAGTDVVLIESRGVSMSDWIPLYCCLQRK